MVPAAAGTFYLATAEPSVLAATLAVMVVGIAAGMEADLLAFLVMRHLGHLAYGKIFAA